MKITELAVRRPILFIILFLVLGILGIFAYTQLRYELLPNIATPYVTITTTYPGASPTEVESGVTRPIEEAVSGADQIRHVTAQSLENVSILTIEYRKDADADRALQEAQRRVNEMLSTLPVGAKVPSLGQYSLADLPVLRIVVSSRLNPLDFGRLLNTQLKARLSQLPGVGQISFIGLPEAEVQVNLNAARLRALNVSVMPIVEALRQSNLNVPAGTIRDTDADYSVRVVGKTDVVGRLRDIVVAPTQTDQPVRLGEVAELILAPKDPENINRFLDKSNSSGGQTGSRQTVGMLVRKQSGANNVEVSRSVRDELVQLEGEFKSAGLHFAVAQDGSEFTLAAAEAVNHDLMLAISLVALIMFVFLHSLRSSLIVMVAIPASLLSTFVFMFLFGFSLNLLTLLAISLVIGILVDDSIVVLESIYQQLEQAGGASAKDKRTAALDGRSAIGFSAIAITLVDVVVFVPLSLAPGLIGDIMREFALVVVLATLFSLLVSFTLTPMIAARFGQVEDLTGNTFLARFGRWFEGRINQITETYDRRLAWCLHHRVITAFVVVTLFGASLLLPALGFIGSEFTAPTDKGEANILLQLPAGTKLERTDAVARQFERRLRQMPEVRRVFTNVGANPDGLIGIASANAVEFAVTFSPREEREKDLTTLIREAKALAAQLPGVRIRAFPIGLLGSDNATPIVLTVSGADREQIGPYARRIADVVRGVSGTADVRTSGTTRKPEIRIDTDRTRLARYGLTTEAVGAAVRVALAGFDELKIQQDNRSVPLRVRYAEPFRSRTDQLGDLTLQNAGGQAVQLRQVAAIHETVDPAILERRDRNSSVTVSAQVIGRATGDAGDDIRRAIAGLHLPASVQVFYGGDLELQDESFGKLGLVFAAAILFMYLIMVALYNSWLYPFVVLFSIPVALVGALLALALTMQSLNIFSILGIIMMVGLVAKNAILLVDRANQNRAGGMPLEDALRESGRSRLRPILMTTLAMVIGMSPIALASGPGAELKTGLAWALIGGLSSSMLLTLVFVPTVYADLTRLSEWVSRLWGRKGPVGAPAKPTIVAGVASLLLLGSTYGQSQSVSIRLSMADAVVLVKRQNGEVLTTRFDGQRADARLDEARRAALPSLNGSGQYTRYLKPAVFFFPAVSVDQTTGDFRFDDSRLTPVTATLPNGLNAGINLAMPIIQPDLSINRQLARLGQRQADEALRAVINRQVAEVKKTYLTLLLADSQRVLAGQTIGRAGENLREARNLFRAQLTTDADTLRAFVALENERPRLSALERNVRLLRANLATLLGVDARAELVLTDSLSLPALGGELTVADGAMTQALTSRPELAQLTLSVEQAERQTDLERARSRPTLGLFGQLSVQSQLKTADFTRSPWPVTSFVGLQLTVPVFNATTVPKVRQARLVMAQAQQQLLYTKRLIANETQAALVTLNEARERVQRQAYVIRSAERSYRQTLGRYRQGLTKFNELNDAGLALLQTQTNRLQAVYDYQMAQVTLDKAVGRD